MRDERKKFWMTSQKEAMDDDSVYSEWKWTDIILLIWKKVELWTRRGLQFRFVLFFCFFFICYVKNFFVCGGDDDG